MNSLCSAAKAYLVLGDERYLKAAVNGFNFVAEQSWATGGWGPNETFLPYPARLDYTDPATGEKKHEAALESLGDALSSTPWHFETPCGSQAHFKLMRYLLHHEDPRYGDSMERVMYNTVLGVLPLNKFGKAFYQSNYHAHAHKAYFDGYSNIMEDEWPCCSGTLPRWPPITTSARIFATRKSVRQPLHPIDASMDHEGHPVSLTQSGSYPLSDDIAFEIGTERPQRFTVRLRIPAWAQSPSVRINGKPVSALVQAGNFVTLQREWRSGDRVELRLPRQLELKPVDAKHPSQVALTYGPLVLFALRDDTPMVTRAELLSAKQQSPASAEWLANTSVGPLRLVPFWTIKDETYFTYLKV